MSTKILVVDDEPDIRFLLKDILEDEGYSVDVAANAVQASEQKSIFSPDLVLLDIWMPEMDGVSLLKQWKDNNNLDCPVVMMSGHGTVETAVEATRFGAFDFVEKPLSTAKLIRTVKSALDHGERPSNELTPAESEQPVGNSRQMQELRRILQAKALEMNPVFFTGLPGSGVRIWANYLFSLQKGHAKTTLFNGDLNAYRQEFTSNIFIAEVTDLNLQHQRVLLSLLTNQPTSSSTGRLLVVSQYDYEILHGKSEILPDLAEYWRQAIAIPSLNERIEDIPELVEYYVTWFSDKESLPYRHFGVAAQNLIRNHKWHGGLTELKSVLRKILSNSTDDNVELEEIRQILLLSGQSANEFPVDKGSVNESAPNALTLSIDLDLDMRTAREHFEREYLKQQLRLCRYNVSELARKIGQERTNLYRKLKQLGLQSKNKL